MFWNIHWSLSLHFCFLLQDLRSRIQYLHIYISNLTISIQLPRTPKKVWAGDSRVCPRIVKFYQRSTPLKTPFSLKLTTCLTSWRKSSKQQDEQRTKPFILIGWCWEKMLSLIWSELYHIFITFLTARASDTLLGWTVMFWNDDWLCLPTFTDKANLGKRQPSLYWRRHRKTPQPSLHPLCTAGTCEARWEWAPILPSSPDKIRIFNMIPFLQN